MPRTYEQPTVSTPEWKHDDTVERHPAYGQIAASRVEGSAVLYGSEFRHHGYITIRVGHSYKVRGLSYERHHAPLNEEIVEVALSEAQWATFVSTLNRGEGVPCTLQAIGNAQVPQIPDPPRVREAYEDDVKRDMREALDALDTLRTAIESLRMPATARKELLGYVHAAIARLTDGIPFVAKSFAEHAETVSEHAKIEIEAYASRVINKAGLVAIAQATGIALPARPIEIETKGGER